MTLFPKNYSLTEQDYVNFSTENTIFPENLPLFCQYFVYYLTKFYRPGQSITPVYIINRFSHKLFL